MSSLPPAAAQVVNALSVSLSVTLRPPVPVPMRAPHSGILPWFRPSGYVGSYRSPRLWAPANALPAASPPMPVNKATPVTLPPGR
jgi:hypothetical protein